MQYPLLRIVNRESKLLIFALLATHRPKATEP